MSATFQRSKDGWITFECLADGIQPFLSVECYLDDVPEFVAVNGYLPKECRECYKLLLFLKEPPSKIHVGLERMIGEFPVPIAGKYGLSFKGGTIVVLNYYRNKDDMLKVRGILDNVFRQYQMEGYSEWSMSCKEWRDLYPRLFKSAKELYPTVEHEITMKEWLKEKK